MRSLLLIAIAVTSQVALAAGGIFSWTDSSGNLVFGDNPPDTSAAIAVTPSKLTVLEGFSSRYQQDALPPENSYKAPTKPKNTKPTSFYTKLNVIAPKMGQAIRANDGDVSVALNLSPKLRSGDLIVITLDGKEFSRGTSRVANLPNLDRGEHKLSVHVLSKTAHQLIKSDVVFTVLRNSKLINKKPYSPYDESKMIKPYDIYK